MTYFKFLCERAEDRLSHGRSPYAKSAPRASLMIDKPFGFFPGTEMPNVGWWEALWPDPAGVLAMVGIKSGMDVIDLCSGDGWFTLQIAKLARRVVAIDIDAALLEVARHRLRESNLSNCHFVAGDAYNITRLWTLPVDFVFLANAFHGVPDQPRLASSVRAAGLSMPPVGDDPVPRSARPAAAPTISSSAAFATSARAPSSPRWRRRPAAAAPPRRPERVAPLTDVASMDKDERQRGSVCS